MSEDNPLAFPSQTLGQDGLPSHEAAMGMTLRDWFAGQALDGLVAGTDMNVEDHAAHFAAAAYIIADAMLAERTQ